MKTKPLPPLGERVALLPRQGAVSSASPAGRTNPLTRHPLIFAQVQPPTRAPGAELAGRALKNSRDHGNNNACEIIIIILLFFLCYFPV